jgi:catechol 2,3-dioxygenase-like lactoylglutathione lyase family enzyme
MVLKAHVSLNVSDLSESLDFYAKMLGIAPSKVRPGYAKFDVETPSLNLSLVEADSIQRPGSLSHLGIQVETPDDVLAMRDRWREAGLATEDEMQTNCCYALQDKTWVRDPDGNAWEVFAVLKDNLSESTACCGSSADELVTLS